MNNARYAAHRFVPRVSSDAIASILDRDFTLYGLCATEEVEIGQGVTRRRAADVTKLVIGPDGSVVLPESALAEQPIR